MERSHCEMANLPCQRCGEAVAGEVWVIVDVEERPDLLARLQQGTLHNLVCAHCGHEATLDAPVLIYRPGEEPPLLYSPARGANHEQADEQAAALLGMLREAMGGLWEPEWIAKGVHGIAREALPLVLGDDPRVARGLAAAAAAEDEVPPHVRAALEEVLSTLAEAGVRVATPEDLMQALEARPELKARLTQALSN